MKSYKDRIKLIKDKLSDGDIVIFGPKVPADVFLIKKKNDRMTIQKCKIFANMED